MSDLVFCRHAESEFNKRSVINADPAIANPLSPEGREQARRLRGLLVGEKFDLCVTSGLERAQETAAIVWEGRTAPTLMIAQLNEPAAGVFEGGPVDAYDDWFTKHGLGERHPSGGESQLDALARFIGAFRTLCGRSEGSILVVAHALPLAWLREGLCLSENAGRGVKIAFKEPGVALATPYPYSRREVSDSAKALQAWLDRSSRTTP